jgi:5-oxoprolinase (ATP-hydrolysing) subunit A
MNDSERDAAVARRAIDLNADLGEGFPNDVALLDRVSSASVSCGAHAGDVDAIRRTLRAAAERGVVVGAHPGYRDREGFGRREQDLSAEEVALLVLDQIADLDRLGRDVGTPIRFVKPHGALYNQAQRQESIARGLVQAVAQWGLPLLGQPRTPLETLARSAGLRYVAEGFPDRRYRPDGSLTPRSEPGAVLSDLEAVAANVRTLLADDRVATLCVHGDEPSAVDVADQLRTVVTSRGIAVRSFLD